MDQELIKKAVKAGFEYSEFHQCLLVMHSNGSWISVDDKLEKFAQLVQDSVESKGNECPTVPQPDPEKRR